MTFKYRYRKQILFSLCLIILVAGTIFYFIINNNDKKEIVKETKLITKKKKRKKIKKKEKTIMVDVKGQVINKGIYKLKIGSRVIDAINMAGGITDKGDTSVLNLSKKLKDEMVIIVYSYYEVEHFKETKEEETNIQNNCVNGIDGINNDGCISDNSSNSENITTISINTATVEDFRKLPGIGEEKAKNIIEYRNSNGGFKTIEDIKNVSGIGDSIFEKIKDYITI